MKRRIARLIGIGLIISGLLASCSSAREQRTPTSSPPTVTATVVLPRPPITPAAGQLILQPPAVTLQAQDGEQQANIGAYYWVHPSGLAAEGKAQGIPAQTSPLTLHAGETVHFRFANGPTPSQLTVAAYTQADNTGALGPSNTPAFFPKTTPASTTTLQPADNSYAWTVSLPPGTYYLALHATWPSPEKNPIAGRQPTADYAFTVTVQ